MRYQTTYLRQDIIFALTVSFLYCEAKYFLNPLFPDARLLLIEPISAHLKQN
jgi:hypothetical protein